MCVVEKALQRIKYIQETFLEKDWDVYQERLRVITNEGSFEPKGRPGYKNYLYKDRNRAPTRLVETSGG
jgi:hypothetical protein